MVDPDETFNDSLRFTVDFEKIELEREKVRLQDRQQRREIIQEGILEGMLTLVIPAAILTVILTVVFLVADGCSDGADREQRAKMTCIREHGTWTSEGTNTWCKWKGSSD